MGLAGANMMDPLDHEYVEWPRHPRPPSTSPPWVDDWLLVYAYLAILALSLAAHGVSAYWRQARIIWAWKAEVEAPEEKEEDEVSGASRARADGRDDCVICLEPLLATQRRKRFSRTCGHAFHAACIEEWLCRSATSVCPTCRTPHRLFGDAPSSSSSTRPPRPPTGLRLVDAWWTGFAPAPASLML